MEKMALESFEFKWEIKMVMAWMEESLEIRIGAVADSASNFAFKVQYYTYKYVIIYTVNFRFKEVF